MIRYGIPSSIWSQCDNKRVQVLGKVGTSEQYDVHTVYKDEAILPAYLIIYAR